MQSTQVPVSPQLVGVPRHVAASGSSATSPGASAATSFVASPLAVSAGASADDVSLVASDASFPEALSEASASSVASVPPSEPLSCAVASRSRGASDGPSEDESTVASPCASICASAPPSSPGRVPVKSVPPHAAKNEKAKPAPSAMPQRDTRVGILEEYHVAAAPRSSGQPRATGAPARRRTAEGLSSTA